MSGLTSYFVGSSQPDKPPDVEIQKLERKKATTKDLLKIIQGIESDKNLSAEHADGELEEEMKFLFGIMNQYKFIFPLNSSRLYEVCIFKKLLLRVEEMEEETTDVFSIYYLLSLVIHWQEKYFDENYISKLRELLFKLKTDLGQLPGTSKLAFRESLNLTYLHEILKKENEEVGTHYLQQIEQYFQDNYPQQAIISIQTNHYLYNYLEMLQKIWCDVVEADPICTWPAFMSTMQMHHNMLEGFKKWKSKCECVKKEYSQEDETNKKISNLLDDLIQAIGHIIKHMDPDGESKSLKYAGKDIEKIMQAIMKLQEIFNKTEGPHFNYGHFHVYESYFHAKLKDNHDQERSIELLDAPNQTYDAKECTRKFLVPSAYEDTTTLVVPMDFCQSLNHVFKVSESGSVILSQDPVCQEIITSTLNNFGINLRQSKPIDKVEGNKHFMCSLGIITDSDYSAYLSHFTPLSYSKTKQQGSWDITLDTMASIEKSGHKDLNASNSLNMLFEDDPQQLPANVKGYLLQKFLSNCFFEFCRPLNRSMYSEGFVDKLKSKFERKLMSERWDSCARISEIVSETRPDITSEFVFRKFYGDMTFFEIQVTLSTYDTDSAENTELKQESTVQKQSLLDYAKQSLSDIANKMKSLTQTGTDVSQDMKDDTTSSEELQLQIKKDVDNYLEKYRSIKSQTDTGERNTRMQQLLEDAKKIKEHHDKAKLVLEKRTTGKMQKMLSLGEEINKLEDAAKQEALDKLQPKVNEIQKDQVILDEFTKKQAELRQLIFLISIEFVERGQGVGRTAEDVELRQGQRLENDDGGKGPARTTSPPQYDAIGSSVGLNDRGGNGGASPILGSDTSIPAATPSVPSTGVGLFGAQTARIDIGSGSDTAAAGSSTNTSPQPRSTFAGPAKAGKSLLPLPSANQRQNTPEQIVGIQNATSLQNLALGTNEGSSAAEHVKSEEIFSGMNLFKGEEDAESKLLEMGSSEDATPAPAQAPTPAPTPAPTLAPAAAARPKVHGPGNEKLKQIAPIEKILEYSYNFNAAQLASLSIDTSVIDNLYKSINLSPQPTVHEISRGRSEGGKDSVFRQNMSAYYAYYQKHEKEYEWRKLHLFVVLHTTQNISRRAEQILRILGNPDAKNAQIQKECEEKEFKDIILPGWINEEYLNEIISKTQQYVPGQTLTTKEIFNFATKFDYFKPQTPEMDQIKLKVKFLLLIQVSKKIIGDAANTRKKQIKERDTNHSQVTGNWLFTQPSAWCDDGADESPPESARVCCMCGMCPSVVQNAQKTGLLVYGTAPPAHPLVNTFSTHPVYAAPSRLVFAAAPMPGMVPGTQAQQVYILRL